MKVQVELGLKTNKKDYKEPIGSLVYIGEFDPGSGRTLAACLTHASRTDLIEACFMKD